MTAITIARNSSYLTLTKNQVAKSAGVAGSLVIHYFKTMTGLKQAVMQYAVDNSDVRLLSQGLAHHDRIALQCDAKAVISVGEYIKNGGITA